MFPQSEEEFRKLAAKANLIPVYEEYSAALETPLSAFLKLKKSSFAYLLESVEGGSQPGRYSFIGVDPSILFEAKDGKVTVTKQGKTIKYISNDPLQELQKIFESYQPLEVPGLPAFSGGAVGYLGYDMIRYWEEIPKPAEKDTGYPDCFFMFADTLIIFDHFKQTMKITVNVSVGNDPEKDYNKAVSKIKEISSILNKPLADILTLKGGLSMQGTDYSYNCTSEEFQEMVKKAKEYIRAGDIFQVVLSRKINFTLQSDPILIYRSLRSLNPSPYMYYLSFGEIKIVGSSPEVMVKVVDGRAELKPIAGTRPRGKTKEEDEKLARELLADEKERAEHLMLVDLGRNDLGRVSEYGSVKVNDYMQIENYSHVMHIVSKVAGRVRKEYTCFDVLKASFPAGTVSGAPKIRAMEIIDELEPDGRGPYAGAVGYISYTGNMDTCIAIRTLFIKGNKGYIQAGAGIVADSNPLNEYYEVCNKSQALVNALERAERGESLAVGN
ncbi:MAG: trpE [Clostridiales bacterium]|jgi:anthranilate synthase component 1|nr:trpE [Clostridiales bacterium]